MEYSFGIIPVRKVPPEALFLLVKHAAGHWAFPKGHPEEGESPLETAMREFEEETGIRDYDVVKEKSFGEEYWFERDGVTVQKLVIYFLAHVNEESAAPQERDIAEAAWFSYDDARRMITHEENRKVLEEAHHYLHGDQTEV